MFAHSSHHPHARHAWRHRTLLAAAMLALAALLAHVGAPSAHGQAARPLTLKGAPYDLGVAPDGAPLAAIAYPRKSTDAEIRRIDGRPPPRLPLLATSGEHGYVTPATLPDGGGVVAYSRQVTADSKPFVEVVGVSPLGVTWGPSVVSSAGREAQPLGSVVVGPTGTIAVPYVEGSTKDAVRWLAVKPAGAVEFATSVELGNVTDSKNVEFTTSLGPDGGGVVLGTSSGGDAVDATARRIFPDGRLGGPIPTGLGGHALTDTRMTFTPGGTLVLVAATLDGINAERGDVLVTTLAPGADAFSPVRTLAVGGNSSAQRGNLSVTTGANERVVILAGVAKTKLHLFEGTPAQLTPTATFGGVLPFGGRAVLAGDGSVSVLWSDEKRVGKGKVSGSPRLQGARRPAGTTGRFGKTRTLLAFPKAGGLSLDHAIGLRDGRVAVLLTPYDAQALEPESTRALITKP